MEAIDNLSGVNMKFNVMALVLVMGSTTAVFAKESTKQIDTAKSQVIWHGSKVVGGAHNGKVSIKEGSVVLDGDKVKSANVVVDLTTIVNDDLKDKSYNEKLVGHLKSDDFFDVAKHPTATLAVTKVTAGKKGEYTGEGTLTIKGQSKPVKFDAMQTGETFKTSLKIDRTEYGVKYGSDKFFKNLGDKVISDEIKLDVEIALK
jgi:polyisoprenoid-binding protein YceI